MATLILIVIFICFGHAHGHSMVNGPQTIMVDIKGQGLIKGNYARTAWTAQIFMQFRGIPYAESPSGSLRFKAPVARLPWQNYFDATQWGRRCPVHTTINSLNDEELQQDLEDCLNLNVYTKNLTAKSPVMVYIHGGGFYNGTSHDHPPNYLLEKNIVLVVPQYRLGALGFLSTKTDEIPGNAGIADILLALQWIQQHIKTFGGDPERITLFGQSAGAAMIGALLLSPKTADGLFQRAILQSGSILGHWSMLYDPIERSKEICINLGCDVCENLAQRNACLMEVSVPQLLNATKEAWICPVFADKLDILPHHPLELLEKLNKSVSIMNGFTKHDGSYVLGVYYDEMRKAHGNHTLTVRQFIDGAFSRIKDPTGLSSNLQKRLFFKGAILDSTDHAKALPAYFDIFSSQDFKSPALALNSQLMKRNLGKIYFYTFDYAGQHTRFGYEEGNEHYPFNGGVHHSNDNIYLFPTHPLNGKDTRIAMKMVDYWTSFAINGAPFSYGDENVTIPCMETENGPYFHIDEQLTIGYDIFDELTATMDDAQNYKLWRNRINFL